MKGPNGIRRRSLLAVAGSGLAACCALTAVLAGCGHPAGGPAAVARDEIGPAPAAATTAAPTSAATPDPRPTLAGATPARLVVPDLIASLPGGVTSADLGRVQRLSGVRGVLAIDGARITVNGTRLTVLAAPAAALRPWTPPATAASTATWTAFGAGDLITTEAAAATARLARGTGYPVAAAVRTQITAGGTAPLGMTGVDGVVNQAVGRKLGLVRNVAVLVNAPGVGVTALVAQVKAALGPGARVVPLVSATESAHLPVDTTPSSGRPANYLELFKASAARYCPGLSWTVLAAIGQIESADGQNLGPSTAGALGPMQFLPSTWAVWGISGFGDPEPPDIMNPFDAVPSAARLLCASGAATGDQGLRRAIFAYNHANWYVDEVLALAAEYAREY